MQQIKPVNFVVITDGAPTDDPETVIMTAARRLDQGRFPISQVGIQFVQVCAVWVKKWPYLYKLTDWK
jgi:hypothetical protein